MTLLMTTCSESPANWVQVPLTVGVVSLVVRAVTVGLLRPVTVVETPEGLVATPVTRAYGERPPVGSVPDVGVAVPRSTDQFLGADPDCTVAE